jgi:hypothetical protein
LQRRERIASVLQYDPSNDFRSPQLHFWTSAIGSFFIGVGLILAGHYLG